MKHAWYEEIFKIIDQVMLLRVPFEIIHFPDTGVSSAIIKYAELGKIDPDLECKCFLIDFRASRFTSNKEANRHEFFRILKAHMELYLDNPFPNTDEHNIFRAIEQVIGKYLLAKRKVLFVMQTSAQIDLNNVPEFRDFILFLDHLRDNTKGNVNFIIATSVPQFNDTNPSPVALIAKYFDYYRQGWIYRSINEDILGDSPFKKHTPNDVLKLIELTGGLPALVKSLIRDFIMLGNKLSEINNLKIDSEFFTKYINCTMRLNRIFSQLPREYIEALYKIILEKDINTIPSDVMEYLEKTSILDEKGKVRGQIVVEYIKIFNKKLGHNSEKIINEPQQKVLSSIEQQDVKVENTEANKFINISPKMAINITSGEIIINQIPQAAYLSEKELAIFRLLLQKANEPVTREEIAKSIWTDSSNDYSDWAIDKLISRLREKLGDKKPNRIVKTLRDKGFILIK